MIAPVFKDRSQAGAGLAAALPDLRLKSNVTVIGLARGGVEVAYETASLLHLPLDVLCITKVGMPGYPELAMGAEAPQGERFTNRRIASLLTTRQIEEAYDAAMVEARAMDDRLRGGQPMNLVGRVAVIIDDGAATGASARRWCRTNPARRSERAPRRRRQAQHWCTWVPTGRAARG